LQRIAPNLKLDWPDRDASKEVKAKHEVVLQRNLGNFSKLWKDAQNSPEVAKRIAKINQEAGLEPKEERLDQR
jgi:hypothetical protein